MIMFKNHFENFRARTCGGGRKHKLFNSPGE